MRGGQIKSILSKTVSVASSMETAASGKDVLQPSPGAAEGPSIVNSFKRPQSFPLRLSPSTRQQATDLAKMEGISLNHFISLAVAEKISRLEQSSFVSQQMSASGKSAPTAGNGFRMRSSS